MDINEIKNLIKFVSKYKVEEVKLEIGGTKISIKTGSSVKFNNNASALVTNLKAEDINKVNTGSQEVLTEGTDTSIANETEKLNENVVTIKSPIIGTFYIKPSPDKKPYISVGSEVKKGDVLCVIEAMKLFNEIESDIDGKIVKVLVEDSTPVEFDEPLFLIEPI
jgi:acetyl-CoA carboxylase biotin carboxyl carrier protein